MRLPPDTEIIKYTSSIGGPKIPGTTNRGRKKTISLDPPSVSVMPTHSSTGIPIDLGPPFKTQVNFGQRARVSKFIIFHHFVIVNKMFQTLTDPDGADHVEVIKLPAHSSSNGIVSVEPCSEGPLNLCTKSRNKDEVIIEKDRICELFSN